MAGKSKIKEVGMGGRVGGDRPGLDHIAWFPISSYDEIQNIPGFYGNMSSKIPFLSKPSWVKWHFWKWKSSWLIKKGGKSGQICHLLTEYQTICKHFHSWWNEAFSSEIYYWSSPCQSRSLHPDLWDSSFNLLAHCHDGHIDSNYEVQFAYDCSISFDHFYLFASNCSASSTTEEFNDHDFLWLSVGSRNRLLGFESNSLYITVVWPWQVTFAHFSHLKFIDKLVPVSKNSWEY